MNSAEHREEGLGGDAYLKRLGKRACLRVTERDAEREGWGRGVFMIVECWIEGTTYGQGLHGGTEGQHADVR